MSTYLACAASALISLAAAIPLEARNGAADLARLVVVGDSLTAGFQDFSLYDSDSVAGVPPGGQKYGYAALVAKQAGVSLVQPLLSFPGIPPALTLSPSGQIVRASGAGVREDPSQQAFNLSVPGFTVADSLAHAMPGDPVNNPVDAMSDLILATPGNVVPGCGPIPTSLVPLRGLPSALVVSQAACAVALRPTTVLVSLGNNDALQALTLGLPPTPTGVFAVQFGAVLRVLAGTGASLVVANIPDVTVLPFLLPVPAFKAACAAPVPPLDPAVTDADFVVPNLANPAASTMDVCTNYAVRSSALIAQARTAVAAYNNIIAAEARRLGGAVVDINGLVGRIARDGYPAAGRQLTTAFLGGLFSLDGIHPTNTGYAILANEAINTINARLGGHIPLVSVDEVAAADPLIPPAP